MLIRAVHDFFAHRPTDPQAVERLVQSADVPEQRWQPELSLSDVRNAHTTNTPAEMAHALKGDYNCLEADIRLEGNLRPFPGYRDRPVIAAHWDWNTHGFLLHEWLRVGVASGRMLKLDCKSGAAVPEALRQCKAFGVPGEKLILNGGVELHPWSSPMGIAMSIHNIFFASKTSLDTLKLMRKVYPTATIAISPSHQPKSDKDYARIERYARAVGGRLMFPLPAQQVDAEVVRRLKPFGAVAIYNDPRTYNPPDAAADRARFQAMGVDGVIDIRTT
jgi:hypothetical protein